MTVSISSTKHHNIHSIKLWLNSVFKPDSTKSESQRGFSDSTLSPYSQTQIEPRRTSISTPPSTLSPPPPSRRRTTLSHPPPTREVDPDVFPYVPHPPANSKWGTRRRSVNLFVDTANAVAVMHEKKRVARIQKEQQQQKGWLAQQQLLQQQQMCIPVNVPVRGEYQKPSQGQYLNVSRGHRRTVSDYWGGGGTCRWELYRWTGVYV